MKNRLIVTAAVLIAMLVVAPGAFGQKKSHGSSRADSQLATLTSALNLTEDEQAKIKPILQDESAKIRAVKNDSSLSKDDQKAKNKVIRNDATQQIRALLTPDQQKTYDGISKKGHGKKNASAPASAPSL